MLAYLVEFLGTFLFLSVIIATGQPILAGMALVLVILLGADISGGHFNPAVSLMFWINGDLPAKDLVSYIVAQSAGGIGAFAIYSALKNKML